MLGLGHIGDILTSVLGGDHSDRFPEFLGLPGFFY